MGENAGSSHEVENESLGLKGRCSNIYALPTTLIKEHLMDIESENNFRYKCFYKCIYIYNVTHDRKRKISIRD